MLLNIIFHIISHNSQLFGTAFNCIHVNLVTNFTDLRLHTHINLKLNNFFVAALLTLMSFFVLLVNINV